MTGGYRERRINYRDGERWWERLIQTEEGEGKQIEVHLAHWTSCCACVARNVCVQECDWTCSTNSVCEVKCVCVCVCVLLSWSLLLQWDFPQINKDTMKKRDRERGGNQTEERPP